MLVIIVDSTLCFTINVASLACATVAACLL